jgi:hypothetical protein
VRHHPFMRMPPLVVDHVHLEDRSKGWANVHAWVNGELVTGQVSVVKKLHPKPARTKSEFEDAISGIVDQAIAQASAEVRAHTPPRHSGRPASRPSL